MNLENYKIPIKVRADNCYYMSGADFVEFVKTALTNDEIKKEIKDLIESCYVDAERT